MLVAGNSSQMQNQLISGYWRFHSGLAAVFYLVPKEIGNVIEAKNK